MKKFLIIGNQNCVEIINASNRTNEHWIKNIEKENVAHEQERKFEANVNIAKEDNTKIKFKDANKLALGMPAIHSDDWVLVPHAATSRPESDWVQ